MKAFLIFILFCGVTYGQDVWVNTASGGYWRTAPNSTNRDNFSTLGNVNPYTGKAGTITPDNNIQSFNSAEVALNNLMSEPKYYLPSGNGNYTQPEFNVDDVVRNQFHSGSLSDTEIKHTINTSNQEVGHGFKQDVLLDAGLMEVPKKPVLSYQTNITPNHKAEQSFSEKNINIEILVFLGLTVISLFLIFGRKTN